MAGSVLRKIISAFNAGELDPHIEGQVGTEQYQGGLSTCENWLPINEGPLVKRQGFFFIREAAPTASWLSAFRRSIEQEYVLEWSDLTLRFFTNGARIESDPVTPYEVTTPYTAAQAYAVCHQQSFNRLYLNHGEHPPASLLRTSATTFTYAALTLENGPFLPTNSEEAELLTASAATGTGITVTASGSGFTPFEADHVGSLLRIEAKDFADVKQWEPQMDGVVVNDLVRNEGKVYKALSGAKTGTVAPTHSEGAFFDGQNKSDVLNAKGPYGVEWEYVHDRFGIVEITGFTSSTVVTADVVRRLADSVVSDGSHKWAFQAFSEVEGWPNLVTLFKGRRVDFKDLSVIGSVVDDYGDGRVNYATFSNSGILAADLGFRRTLAVEDPPLWVSADRKLLVGTATREMAIGPANNGAPFSGENIEAEPQSFYGSELVWPMQVATETVFVERGGRRLRGADYDFGRDRYDAFDMTAASREITRGGIVQLAYQRLPHAFCWAVRGDGQLVLHPKSRAEVKGFARIKLGGDARVLSAVAVMGEDGQTSDLWVLVERVNGLGNTVREIWMQAEWRELGTDIKQSYYVDGGARFTGTGGDGDFTGFTHLAGQTVVALVNGVVVKDLLVSPTGDVSLPADVVPPEDYTVSIGMPYTATARTMRPHISSERGPSSGLRQRLIKVVSRVLETVGLKVAGSASAFPEEVMLREGGDPMDAQKPLKTGDTEGLIEADFDRDGRATWISEDPLPATVTMAILNIDVSWKDA